MRLLDASPGDVVAVTRQVGPIQNSLRREPDITIRFVDKLPLPDDVRFVGLDDCGFTADAFLVLRSKHGTRVRVSVRLDQVGKCCEIVCETGLHSVPLLIPIINLTAMNNGALPLHASAFTYHGTGVLATGWAKGGKTETLLAFMAAGAQYVGDEWVYLSGDGRQMYGIPEPIRLWDWQLQELPQYQTTLGRGDKSRLLALELVVQATEQVLPAAGQRQSPAAGALGRLSSLVKRQQYIQLRPHAVFGQFSCPLTGPLHKVFFVMSHDSPDISVQPVDAREVAERMAISLQYERLDFMSYYYKFKYAFPDLHNELIERAEDVQLEMLQRALDQKETYVVYHPYPVSIPALFQAINPLIG